MEPAVRLEINEFFHCHNFIVIKCLSLFKRILLFTGESKIALQIAKPAFVSQVF
jgi:hypothetical protein